MYNSWTYHCFESNLYNKLMERSKKYYVFVSLITSASQLRQKNLQKTTLLNIIINNNNNNNNQYIVKCLLFIGKQVCIYGRNHWFNFPNEQWKFKEISHPLCQYIWIYVKDSLLYIYIYILIVMVLINYIKFVGLYNKLVTLKQNTHINKTTPPPNNKTQTSN